MSSEIETHDSAAYAEKPAWHGLGKVFSDAMTAKECLENGLDWMVTQSDLFYRTQDANGIYTRLPADGWRANVRSDTGQLLGLVSDGYVLVQNVEAFAFLDALVADGSMRYEAAFSLRNGKRVCILARMPEFDDIAEGDRLHRYVLFCNQHDGSGSIQVWPTNVRVVCANTRAIAMGDRGDRITISHRGDLKTKLERARQVIRSVGDQFTAAAADARRLAAARLTDDQFAEFVERVVPMPDPDDIENLLTPRQANYLQKIRDTVVGNYLVDSRQQMPAITRTAWAAYNAVSQYVDHDVKRRSRESRLSSVVLGGRGAQTKDHAHQVALDIARAN